MDTGLSPWRVALADEPVRGAAATPEANVGPAQAVVVQVLVGVQAVRSSDARPTGHHRWSLLELLARFLGALVGILWAIILWVSTMGRAVLGWQCRRRAGGAMIAQLEDGCASRAPSPTRSRSVERAARDEAP